MSTPIDLEKLRSVSVAGSATPSRNPRNAELAATERQWSRDFAAYRRLRKDGLRPRSSDGAADLEQRAKSAEQVEGRPEQADVERVFS